MIEHLYLRALKSTRKVLIVEDDPFSQRLFANILLAVDSQLDILFAENCTEAESYLILYHHAIDLVILDVYLSDERTGIDFYKILTHFDIEVPILITSSISESQLIDLLQKEKLRRVPFLQKPFHPDLCTSALLTLIK